MKGTYIDEWKAGVNMAGTEDLRRREYTASNATDMIEHEVRRLDSALVTLEAGRDAEARRIVASVGYSLLGIAAEVGGV